ncbi:hypothetical protein UFOVP1146_140 [uncultured Caudovirales phage]|jgi:hypothetical protein|uniref:Uncharacterized protein n=1 Tax=uncultured Caudovirales phage TaxID=2100421 RepID=A0A6J5PDB2_9CAUD|nr:hypothetical protein UFOVP812_53 [uncultured Caudovirales phage]CAB4165554.1 hypothetical protein UFOVP818_90 [uncultured Caudovirales phage]CAB4186794.1 hypothetical protein UFOVP1146_140 [uncultured Caudovirales phage]CAB4220434.1 hypothetical protein UFOVP1638_3 [uncultured Caudovirales phage]
MLKELYKKVIAWVTLSNTNHELERYINSKQPKNAAEIEHWCRAWEFDKTKGIL